MDHEVVGGSSSGRWTAADGQRALDAWRASGLSRRVWCAQAGLALHRLYYWESRLEASQPEEPGFIPITLAASAFLRVRVERGSVSIAVESGFDAGLLRQVVEALQ